MEMQKLTFLARTAATSDAHWARFFDALRENWQVDRICAALQLDDYTAYLPRVAQIDSFEPFVGGTGLYADREVSCTFGVIAGGVPYLAREDDWQTHPDLSFYSVVAKSNLKFPISLGGYPAVLNIWSAKPDAFGEGDLLALADIAAEVSRSPFRLALEPVGLALRKTKALLETRQAALDQAAAQ